MDCPCCSGKPFAECCEPVIAGARKATSAEELMRSRYSAYATGAIDWIRSCEIVAQVALGARAARELQCVLDRSTAIAQAVGKAAAEDVVLVAGKGHEDYQIIGTRKQPYSDLAQVRAALSERGRR